MNIVWDVGNVLIRWEPRLVYAEDFGSDAEIDTFLEKIDFAAWNLEQDRGRTWDEAVALKVAEFPQHEALISKFHANWQEAVPGAIEGSVAILESLRRGGRPLYAITNFSAEKWQQSCARFPFLTSFRHAMVSAHEGLIKPDPAIFNRFLQRTSLKAADCLFIDDSAANIATAKGMGFDTIRFESAGHLKRALADRGIAV
ncbi:MAG: HAD family phosphatase [Pseudomonadota bacterium]